MQLLHRLALGRHGDHSDVDPKLYGPKVSASYWHNDWEPEEAMHNQPESPALLQACMKQASERRALASQRLDMHLTDALRQGHGREQPGITTLSLHHLADNIQMTTSCTVNPDGDLRATGSYHIQTHPEDACLTGVHSPTGVFLGDVTMHRLSLLLRCAAYSTSQSCSRRQT